MLIFSPESLPCRLDELLPLESPCSRRLGFCGSATCFPKDVFIGGEPLRPEHRVEEEELSDEKEERRGSRERQDQEA